MKRVEGMGVLRCCCEKCHGRRYFDDVEEFLAHTLEASVARHPSQCPGAAHAVPCGTVSVQPHPYQGWVDENDVGNTCCLEPRLSPVHVLPRVLKFRVHGLPHPQGSMKAHPTANGKVALRYPPHVYHWRSQVQQAAVDALGATPAYADDVPIELRLGFDLPRPAGHLSVNRKLPPGTLLPSAPAHPTVTPDLDKLVRAICDSCTDAGVWHDDAQVVLIQAAKRYSNPPGVFISITELL